LQTREGSTDADIRTFWSKKFGFFEVFGVSTRPRDVGVNVSRFFADVFYKPLNANILGFRKK